MRRIFSLLSYLFILFGLSSAKPTITTGAPENGTETSHGNEGVSHTTLAHLSSVGTTKGDRSTAAFDHQAVTNSSSLSWSRVETETTTQNGLENKNISTLSTSNDQHSTVTRNKKDSATSIQSTPSSVTTEALNQTNTTDVTKGITVHTTTQNYSTDAITTSKTTQSTPLGSTSENKAMTITTTVQTNSTNDTTKAAAGTTTFSKPSKQDLVTTARSVITTTAASQEPTTTTTKRDFTSISSPPTTVTLSDKPKSTAESTNDITTHEISKVTPRDSSSSNSTDPTDEDQTTETTLHYSTSILNTIEVTTLPDNNSTFYITQDSHLATPKPENQDGSNYSTTHIIIIVVVTVVGGLIIIAAIVALIVRYRLQFKFVRLITRKWSTGNMEVQDDFNMANCNDGKSQPPFLENPDREVGVMADPEYHPPEAAFPLEMTGHGVLYKNHAESTHSDDKVEIPELEEVALDDQGCRNPGFRGDGATKF